MEPVALIGYLFTALMGIFVIINPLTTAFVFVSLLPHADEAHRREVAWRAFIVATGVLVGFALIGGIFFQIFGITLEAFRIAGGLILFGLAMNMIRNRPRDRQPAGDEQAMASDGRISDDFSIIPLAIPFISGPGAIATVMILTQQGINMFYTGLVILAILAVTAMCYYAMVYSQYIVRFLGQAGREVASKLFGVILAVIAVQFVINGTGQVLEQMGIVEPGRGNIVEPGPGNIFDPQQNAQPEPEPEPDPDAEPEPGPDGEGSEPEDVEFPETSDDAESENDESEDDASDDDPDALEEPEPVPTPTLKQILDQPRL